MSEPHGIKGTVEIIEPSRAERAIVRRAAESRATVPDLRFAVDVDMSAALALARDQPVSLMALLVRAVAVAIREHPRANGSYRDGHFELYSRVNAAIVLSSGEAATVLDADQKSPQRLAAEIEELERRAAELTPPELAGATFTFARYRVTRAEPLIIPAHAVALAAGEVREVAAVREGVVTPTPTIALSLACDHRIVYGELAASVLSRVRDLLQRGDL